jgi:hypothetical protein
MEVGDQMLAKKASNKKRRAGKVLMPGARAGGGEMGVEEVR